MMDQGGQSPEGQTPEIVELPASSADLLEKYMKLVQQQKEEEQQQDEVNLLALWMNVRFMDGEVVGVRFFLRVG